MAKKSTTSSAAKATSNMSQGVIPASAPSLSKESVVDSSDSSDDSDSESESESESESDDSDDLDDDVDMEGTAESTGASQPKTNKRTGKSVYESYKPPSHMTAYNITSTRLATSEFEWNNLASKNNSEIWAIRLPKDFKMSRLTNLQFQTAPSSSSSSSAHAHSSQLATLSTSKQAYALHDVSSSSTSSSSAKNHQHLPDTFQNPEFVPTLTDDKLLDFDPSSVGGGKRVRGEDSSAIAHQAEVIQEELGEDAGGGGEEMKCLKLMLPDNKRGGKYYLAPRKIDRHVILKTVYAPLSSTSTSDAISNDPANIARLLQAPTVGHTTATSGQKRPQPLEKLKYRNVPFGAVDEVIMKSDKLGADIKNRLVNGILGDVDVAMNENETGEPNSKRSKKEKDVKKEESKSERKKRKSEVGAGAGGEGVPSSQRKSKKTTESVVV